MSFSSSLDLGQGGESSIKPPVAAESELLCVLGRNDDVNDHVTRFRLAIKVFDANICFVSGC